MSCRTICRCSSKKNLYKFSVRGVRTFAQLYRRNICPQKKLRLRDLRQSCSRNDLMVGNGSYALKKLSAQSGLKPDGAAFQIRVWSSHLWLLSATRVLTVLSAFVIMHRATPCVLRCLPLVSQAQVVCCVWYI